MVLLYHLGVFLNQVAYFHIMYMSKLPSDCSIRVFTIVHKINRCLTYMPIGTPMFSLKLYKQVSLKSYCKAVRYNFLQIL